MEQLNYANTFEINDEEEEELSERENNKKSIITFSKLNKYFLIPFLCPVFFILLNILSNLIDKNKLVITPSFFDSIFEDLSFIFAGFFYFIPYFKANFNKKTDSPSINERNDSGAIYFNNKVKIDKYKFCKIIMIIMLLSLINVIQHFLHNFIFYKKVFEERIYDLYFFPLFSRIILKENIYKHQKFALIISISGIIFLVIPVCLKIRTVDIIPNILNFINGIIFSLFVVIIKYLIEKYYIHPFKISLLLGIISSFLDCIAFISYSLIEYNDLNYFKDCFEFLPNKNKFIIIIYIILFLLLYMIEELLNFLALFYFSPTLLVITNMLTPFIAWIIKSIKYGVKIPDDVLYPIGYLIVIFFALIYNEIIIFNFCGLNKNTKKFVNQRLDKEVKEIKKDQNELLSVKED